MQGTLDTTTKRLLHHDIHPLSFPFLRKALQIKTILRGSLMRVDVQMVVISDALGLFFIIFSLNRVVLNLAFAVFIWTLSCRRARRVSDPQLKSVFSCHFIKLVLVSLCFPPEINHC